MTETPHKSHPLKPDQPDSQGVHAHDARLAAEQPGPKTTDAHDACLAPEQADSKTTNAHDACLAPEQADYESTRDGFARQALEVCASLAQEFGEDFSDDPWRSSLGAGVVRSFANGAVLEKGSVNFSDIAGDSFPASGLDGGSLAGSPFRACGVSLILHPRNPFVPTTHLNVRLITVTPPGRPSQWWFGGGFDLTPYFPFDEDCRLWHRSAATVCRPFGSGVYDDFKRRCDDYFHLPHRQENRGIGGIFFDLLYQWGWQDCRQFADALVPAWQSAWLGIARRRRHVAWTEHHRRFQLFRRGRYVEFNLLYDRGTSFGLHSGGRAESILASLPPVCHWGYRLDRPGADFSDDAERLGAYLRPRQWLDDNDDNDDNDDRSEAPAQTSP